MRERENPNRGHNPLPNTTARRRGRKRVSASELWNLNSEVWRNERALRLWKYEANIDERSREATDLPQIQQGRRSPLLLRQGPQPHPLVFRQRRTLGHFSRPQRRRLVLRRLKQVSHFVFISISISIPISFSISISGDSTRLITGSADQSAKLWSVQTGHQLYSFNFDSPARSVDFSVGDKLAVITTDPFMELPSAIHVKRIANDPTQRNLTSYSLLIFFLLFVLLPMLSSFAFSETGESVLLIKGPQGRINRAIWGPLNTTIISAGEDAVIRIWDSEVTSFPFHPLFFSSFHFANTVASFLCRRENCSKSLTGNLAIKRL